MNSNMTVGYSEAPLATKKLRIRTKTGKKISFVKYLIIYIYIWKIQRN